ncbi:MAG: hypothetical protein JNJ49_03385 [Bdellovibrionaceae bacterium]|nr:hypothetical protein [Pseudobdellovibrionaceae bacterium]
MRKTTTFSTLQILPRLYEPRYIARIVIGLSCLIVFLSLYDMYLYLPLPRGFLKALEKAVLGHSGLWLGTLRIPRRIRYFVAPLMLPSMTVVFLFYWGAHFVFSLAIAAGMLWLLVRVLRGEDFENRSVH